MNFKAKTLMTAALAVTLAFGVAAEEHPTVDTVLASVDGVNITIGHVIALRSRLPEQYQQLPDDILFEGIVEQLIQQTVLMNAMKTELDKRTTIGLENEGRAYLASEMMAKLTARDVSEEVLKAAYEARYDAAIPSQEYNASHILVATREEAAVLIGQLEQAADFATLARENSTGPSGPGGGELGWFGKGDMVPTFEDAVLSLAIGEVSAPVETQFGWHVIKLNDIRNLEIPTLEQARIQLTEELQQTEVEEEVQNLTNAADVTRTKVNVDPSIIRDVSLFD
ncbi:MAG: peptidylprolyl isomerase [Alphaproteobacteria bacterium]|nr:peptidylprolyl isomerase [Alphaproteobacteria bacterium]